VEGYDYKLPKELVAQAPAEPRDAARLFVYDTRADRVTLDIFANLAKYLPVDSVLVLNDTKVVPARLELEKRLGGKVRILFLFNEWNGGATIQGLPDRMIRVGDALRLVGPKPDERLLVEVLSHKNEEYTFKILVPVEEFRKTCAEQGRTPLPPYIHSDLNETELRERYQTEFAEKPASVAAPTASLHFTRGVFKALTEKGIERAHVTLHVGRGTFSPVTDAMKSVGLLHGEPIEVSAKAARLIREAKQSGRTIIAAGTTATRLLEAAASHILAGDIPDDGYRDETQLFIQPPYDFKIVDVLITNFHLPGTSLLVLLDAFLRDKGAKQSWHKLYRHAIAEKFRFYSFGDAMLII